MNSHSIWRVFATPRRSGNLLLPKGGLRSLYQSSTANLMIDIFRVNDIVSYKKDLEQGENFNSMFVFKYQGMTDQEAADRIGEMISECYIRWNDALAEFPFGLWGDKIDKDVEKYIEGCRNLALGNWETVRTV